MKWLIGLLVVVGAVVTINLSRQQSVKVIQKTSHNMQESIQHSAEAMRQKNYDAEKIKVFVPGRDSRTCMEILGVNEINNRVVECNKDHYVEMRRNEVADFKKEQRLP
ncbi:hypothetical protein [Methylovorus mays]|uniref:hypothetical protein n=1 Tax=Methylovorus mays TaxID=184077 RepID=UPI001E497786|nr:hypothetical protein [Methylovorus mays]MCB5206357.1 hypothetical protein [Methylovorus mays]